jgi:hypothetical protein
VYALTPVKAQAVALETQRVWCSLAERLGMFAIKVRWRSRPAHLGTDRMISLLWNYG